MKTSLCYMNEEITVFIFTLSIFLTILPLLRENQEKFRDNSNKSFKPCVNHSGAQVAVVYS